MKERIERLEQELAELRAGLRGGLAYTTPEDITRMAVGLERGLKNLSPESIYMNPRTGSVDYESGWGDDLDGLIEVYFDTHSLSWVECESGEL